MFSENVTMVVHAEKMRANRKHMNRGLWTQNDRYTPQTTHSDAEDDWP